MEDIMIDSEDSSCMFIEGKKKVTSDEQLALFMHKFNLDWDTVEVMPALKHTVKHSSVKTKKNKGPI